MLDPHPLAFEVAIPSRPFGATGADAAGRGPKAEGVEPLDPSADVNESATDPGLDFDDDCDEAGLLVFVEAEDGVPSRPSTRLRLVDDPRPRRSSSGRLVGALSLSCSASRGALASFLALDGLRRSLPEGYGRDAEEEAGGTAGSSDSGFRRRIIPLIAGGTSTSTCGSASSSLTASSPAFRLRSRLFPIRQRFSPSAVHPTSAFACPCDCIRKAAPLAFSFDASSATASAATGAVV